MDTAVHELRNHLCIAMAGIEAFLDRKLEPSDVRLSAIFSALREVDLLIDDLPRDAIGIAPAMRVTPIDVCAVVASQVAAMEGFAMRRRVRVVVDGCAKSHRDDERFFGDPLRIAEIVTNVLMNAVRYTPADGVVRVVFRRDGSRLRLVIADDGPGIAMAERARIFERGYRGRIAAVPPGSGIGLALVKHFVDDQGGTIDVTDSPSCGAMFTIELPAIPPRRRAAGSSPCRCHEREPASRHALGTRRR